MTKLFIDTSAFVAAYHKRDQHHVVARSFLHRALRARTPLVATEYVFDETISLVRRRAGHATAVALGNALRASEGVQLLEVGTPLRERAWQIFVRYRDRDLSFTDCVSFAAMHELGLKQAFTFDGDFAAMGFAMVP